MYICIKPPSHPGFYVGYVLTCHLQDVRIFTIPAAVELGDNSEVGMQGVSNTQFM